MNTWLGHLCLSSVFLFCTGFSWSREKPNIAVMDLDGNNVSQGDLGGFSNRLRTELFNTGKFTVIERGAMDAIMKEQQFQLSDCTSNECVVQIGQLLGVRYIAAGSLDKVGKLYSANIRLINVENGQVERNVLEDCRKCGPEEVLQTTLKQVAEKLAGEDAVSADVPPQETKLSRPAALPMPQPLEMDEEEYQNLDASGFSPGEWRAYRQSGLSLNEYRRKKLGPWYSAKFGNSLLDQLLVENYQKSWHLNAGFQYARHYIGGVANYNYATHREFKGGGLTYLYQIYGVEFMRLFMGASLGYWEVWTGRELYNLRADRETRLLYPKVSFEFGKYLKVYGTGGALVGNGLDWVFNAGLGLEI